MVSQLSVSGKQEYVTEERLCLMEDRKGKLRKD